MQKKRQEGTPGIAQGARNSTLASIAGSLRRKGLDEETILATLHVANERQCKPPLSSEEVKRIAQSIAGYPVNRTQTEHKWTTVVKNLSEYQPEEMEWLWKVRIPLGKLTIIEGDPSAGKSFMTAAIAKAVSLGAPLPCENDEIERMPAKVLMLLAEDGIPETIRPRLEKMGADLKNIDILEAVINEIGNERFFSLAKDLEALEAVLAKGGYRLLIIDPVNSYLGLNIDTNREADVRAILSPLIKLVEKYNVALICIRHLAKSQKEKALYRGLGSISYTAIARAVYLVGKNPLNYAERVMTCTKNSNAPDDIPAIAFEISSSGNFEWKGERNITSEMLSNPAPDQEDDTSALGEAQEFLQATLADGPKCANHVLKEARKNSIMEKTLRRAKKELHIESEKGDKEWQWKLPGKNELAGPASWLPWASSNSQEEDAEKTNTAKMANDIVPTLL
ncbi:MAG: AAA family ATPase [Candidatus Peribacteraceae bacterium]|nr:AAA family ATPase [Candidatus Peribacteraceae bacterium]